MRSLKDLQADFKGKDGAPGQATGQNSGFNAANSGYSIGRAQHIPKVHNRFQRHQWSNSNQVYGYNEDWEGTQWMDTGVSAQWRDSRTVQLRPNTEAKASKKSKAPFQKGEAVILRPREDGGVFPVPGNGDAGASLLRMLKGGGDDGGPLRFPPQAHQQMAPQHYGDEPKVTEKWWLKPPAPVGAPEFLQLDDGLDCPALSIDAFMAMRPRLRPDDPKPDCLPKTLALPRHEESAKEEEAHDANEGEDKDKPAMVSQDGADEVFALDEEAPSTGAEIRASRGFGKWFGRRGPGIGGTSGDGETVAPGTEANMSTDAGSGRDESSDGDGEGYGNSATDWPR